MNAIEDYLLSLPDGHPLQVSIRTYSLALSLSLGPALLSFIVSPKARSKGVLGLQTIVKRELKITSFPFAITVAIGGGSALQYLWKRLETDLDDTLASPKQPWSPRFGRLANQLQALKEYISSISQERKTFAIYACSSFVAIVLMQARRLSSKKLGITMPLISTSRRNVTGRTSATLDLTLLLLVRALDAAVQHVVFKRVGEEHDDARRWRQHITTKIDAMVFWASSARLPSSYMKWITSMANIDPRLSSGLRAIRSGQWSYINGTKLQPNMLATLSQDLGYPASWGTPLSVPAYGGSMANASWKALGVSGRDGVGGVPCEIIHGTGGVSCTGNAIFRAQHAFLKAVAIYLPVHFIPILLTRPRSLLRLPEIFRLLIGAVRSASFLSTFVSSIWMAICLTRTHLIARLLPKISHDFYDGPFGCIMAGCLACGSSIWIENGRRRGEMALYVLPRAIRACLPNTWARSGKGSVYALERIAFTLSLAHLLTSGTYRMDTNRGLARWTLNFVLNGPNAAFRKQQG
ncbi:hypothetical protein HETIRDRAFT_431632 [Heterobasidion irregulare TC 32-1]|uniref:Transmembrane protein 135 N-terminal domain-containing protein n=1 Tax=Heterobasidion irregulare (strain TC 32-1) TaxID=747525 RepID=W4KNC9_HETIT|nr:uncharacterized protein HETIRDRAFT_431632 [Heterobasidion irregulare TC 32-1]ETW87224.1 hypothetical protein HETIRDRAFT_431632 [Heterobasidion irregulare TC 32-1]